MLRLLSFCTICALVVVACAKSPVAPSGASSVVAPAGASPSSGTQVPNRSQPVTLSVDPAFAPSGGALTVTFVVATDASFSTIVATQDVTQSVGTRPTVTLPTLTPGRTYYWRTRPNVDGTAGAFGATSTFIVGPAVELGTPVPVSPLSGAVGLEQRPTLVVANVSTVGPVGALLYRFELSTASAFSTILVSGTVPQGGGLTSFTPAVSLPEEATFYWRVQAVDTANAVTSAYSAVQSGRTTVTIDLRTTNFQRFIDVSNWPETNKIIAVEQDGAGDGPMCINHTKRGQWPSSNFFDDPSVPIEGNQWYLARIGGQWYAGAAEWLRVGQICKTGQTTEAIGPDGTWGGPMDTWRPKRGELVGYMITTPARSYPSFRTIDERSNVVVQPWMINGINTPEGK